MTAAPIRATHERNDDTACRPTLAERAVGYACVRRVADIEARPIRWLWPGRIARGKVTMLAGHPGLGKSQVTASMAAIVTTGGTWPVDRTRAECGNVIILSGEDDPADTIRPRLEAAGADLSHCFVLDAVRELGDDLTPRERMFDLARDIERLSSMVERVGDVALISIDPITAYLGETDSHRNAEVRALLAPLARLAEQHGAAIVGVSHFAKAGGAAALMRVMGSLAFVAAARAAYAVTRDPDDSARRLFLPLKNNIGDDQTGYAFRIERMTLPGGIETSRVVWDAERVTITADQAMTLEPDDERTATDEAMDFLRETLAAGAVKAGDVQRQARQAGISDKALRRARERLGIRPRKREYAGGWWWELPAQDAQDVKLKNVGILDPEGHLGGPDTGEREEF